MKRKNLPEVVPQVFEHEQFGSVRVVKIDGKPWFVGIDVAKALGYTNPQKAIRDHVDDEDKNTVTIRSGIPGNPNMIVINKSGVYSLILDSQMPKAKEFRHWVTSEVLVKIDETGSYNVQQQNSPVIFIGEIDPKLVKSDYLSLKEFWDILDKIQLGQVEIRREKNL